MTNTDKRRYRDLLVTKNLTFKSSKKEKERLFSKVPKLMYKYSKANKCTLKNIKKQQIFLAPIEALDDPFELMISQNIDLIYNEKTELFTEYFVDELAKKIQSKFQLCTVKQIKQIVQNVNKLQRLSSAKILAIATSDTTKHISAKQKKKDEIVKFLQRLSLMFAPNSPLFNAVTSFCKAKEIFGLGCLSEIKNNKVLWSLYSDVYKGVCLEYEIPNDSTFLDIF